MKQKFYAKCVKVLLSPDDQSDGSLANLVGLVSFFGILGLLGVNLSKIKNAGKCHDLHRKCKISIREWEGLFVW